MDDPLSKDYDLRANVVFLALAFLAELVAWSGLGMAAFQLAGRGWQGWLAAIITVVVVITVWGLVASPKAKAPAAAGLATRIIVFAGTVIALTFAGQLVWAGVLALLIGVSQGGIRATTPAALHSLLGTLPSSTTHERLARSGQPRAVELLGWTTRSARETVIDTARSLMA